jgi:hypothetical protein
MVEFIDHGGSAQLLIQVEGLVEISVDEGAIQTET